MKSILIILAVVCGMQLAALAADGTGTSGLTCIDTTDHAAVAAAPVLDARAGAATADSEERIIDTATPFGMVIVVR